MKSMKQVAAAAVILFFSVVMASAMANHGPEEFSLDGGSKGKIDFPHKMHQDALDNDCQACHSVFPKELGVIKKMKKSKELKRKQVMNKTCIKCHKDFKKAGKSYGPISCNDCHKK